MTDPMQVAAIAAIDAGNIAELTALIETDPSLVRDRIANQQEGYFKDPYLLWFIAENPIRTGRLPANIVELTSEFVKAVRRGSIDSFQYQIDYALQLVASGLIARDSGLQPALMDLLLNAGAIPNGAMAALANNNPAAAAHLIDSGDKMNLALAVCLERMDEMDKMLETASSDVKTTALVAAAFYGKENTLRSGGRSPGGDRYLLRLTILQCLPCFFGIGSRKFADSRYFLIARCYQLMCS